MLCNFSDYSCVSSSLVQYSEFEWWGYHSFSGSINCIFFITSSLHTLRLSFVKTWLSYVDILYWHGWCNVLGLNSIFQGQRLRYTGFCSLFLARHECHNILRVYGLWFKSLGSLSMLGPRRGRKTCWRCSKMGILKRNSGTIELADDCLTMNFNLIRKWLAVWHIWKKFKLATSKGLLLIY